MLRLAVLSDDAEAQQVAVTARDVQRCVPALVHQRGVAAGHQQVQAHVGLVGYHSQMERSLRWEENKIFTAANGRKFKKKTILRRHQCGTHLSLVVLYVEEMCVARQVDHCFDVVAGLVDDGQVEQPADTSNKVSAHLQSKCKTSNRKSPHTRTHTHIRPVNFYFFHQN